MHKYIVKSWVRPNRESLLDLQHTQSVLNPGPLVCEYITLSALIQLLFYLN